MRPCDSSPARAFPLQYRLPVARSRRPVSDKTPVKRPPAKSKAPAPKKTRTPSAASLRRRAEQMEAKRAQIIEAALGLFSRFGLHGTSLDQVASQADVSKTNLLYYFGSKEELYVSVLRQLLEVWLRPLKAFSVEQDPVEAIGDYLRVKLELSRDHPEESRLFCMEIMQGAPLLLGELEQPLRELVENKVAVIQGWIDAGKLAPVEPHHLIFSLWATTQHYADFRVQVEAVSGRTLDDPVFFEEALHSLQALILNGVRPR
ncbi:HTH-type transcriptional regulator RutR [Stutzerimonas nosocomialis]|uniref:HTH-type transcriptional regulator RutR n=1 Tax=Stutzerimonas nosocomialis TaxID=1056496 RepID=A0A5R9QGT2_9GAMM|nr:HTH-type transcriptional regulator RutR [Stutzerimonas nosocomialis]